MPWSYVEYTDDLFYNLIISLLSICYPRDRTTKVLQSNGWTTGPDSRQKPIDTKDLYTLLFFSRAQ